MDDGLTYPSMRCILEYLEANKRIHIASRFPTLRQFEKSIPIHMKNLVIGTKFLDINTHSYRVSLNEEEIDQSYTRSRPSKERLLPGDIRIGPDTTSFLEMRIWRSMNQVRVRLPGEIEEHMAVKKIMQCFLGGRPIIHVNELKFGVRSKEILRVPENLMINPRMLSTSTTDFRNLLSVVHPSSFPLKQLETVVETDNALKHNVLKSAERLIIRHFNREEKPWDMPSFQELTNKCIVLQSAASFIREDVIVGIMQRYLRKNPELGSCLIIDQIHIELFLTCIDAVKTQLNGRTVEVASEFPFTCNSIPLDSTTSTLLVYGFSHVRDYMNLKLEVVPLSITTPCQPFAPIDNQAAVIPPAQRGFPSSSLVIVGLIGLCAIFLAAVVDPFGIFTV